MYVSHYDITDAAIELKEYVCGWIMLNLVGTSCTGVTGSLEWEEITYIHRRAHDELYSSSYAVFLMPRGSPLMRQSSSKLDTRYVNLPDVLRNIFMYS